MRAEVVAMTGENLDMDAIKKAGDILKAGGLVAFSYRDCIWTWWKCTGSAGFHEIYAAKGRPSD